MGKTDWFNSDLPRAVIFPAALLYPFSSVDQGASDQINARINSADKMPGKLSRVCNKYLIPLITLIMLLEVGSVMALDANAQGTSAGQGNKHINSITVSIDDVARMIRQNNQWQILDARSRQRGSVIRYRFKLISNKGEVKIINIDPEKPNLRRLEQ